jgi:hypothetical protein
MCNRGLQFWKFAQNGAAPAVHLEKEQESKPNENPPSPTLCPAGDRKLTEMLTGTVPDSGPQPSGTFSTLGWSVIAVKPSESGGGSAGSRCDQIFDMNKSKRISKRHF